MHFIDLYRPQFVYFTFITVFYCRSFLLALLVLPLLGWAGMHHPADNSLASETVILLGNFAAGILLLAFIGILLFRKDILELLWQDIELVVSRKVAPAKCVKIFVALINIALNYFAIEALNYCRGITSRYSAICSVVCIQTFFYLFDNNSSPAEKNSAATSDKYSVDKFIYSLLSRTEAWQHLAIGGIFIGLAFIDLLFVQTRWQNVALCGGLVWFGMLNSKSVLSRFSKKIEKIDTNKFQ